MATPEKNEDGTYPAYAWPGGYPIFYIVESDILCAKCVNDNLGNESFTPTAADINYESALTCDHCGAEIESAYDVVEDQEKPARSSDMDRAVFSCQCAKDEQREISDLTARIIASMYHNGGLSASYAFLSTGYIGQETQPLWLEFFPDYNALSFNEKLLADMLGTYLINRRDREAQEHWQGLHW